VAVLAVVVVKAAAGMETEGEEMAVEAKEVVAMVEVVEQPTPLK